MLTYRDFVTSFRKLEIDLSRPILTHASLSAFGQVNGGAQTILGALSSTFNTLLMPVFTYKTMLTPSLGPPDNAMAYGSGQDTNQMADFFRPGMPADPAIGVIAEALRTHPRASRSSHPILSLAGINARPILDAQTIQEPLLPIQALRDLGGWVLLLGVNHTANTSIHYAEWRAGRKQFLRWALTPRGVVACPGFPGCSNGFEALSPLLAGVIHKVELGESVIQAVPLVELVDTVCLMIKEDPVALLCDSPECGRCNAVRASITAS